MRRQYGFYFDSDRCVQCHACEVACKSWNELELGIFWRRVRESWSGEFPNVLSKTVTLSCMHCGTPACVEVCPEKAVVKRPDNGIVVVDRSKCKACHSCAAACPFHIPQFGRTAVMQKCDFCQERLNQGKQPLCTATCPGEALKCGPLDTLADIARKRPLVRFPGGTIPSMLVSGKLNETDLLAILDKSKDTAATP